MSTVTDSKTINCEFGAGKVTLKKYSARIHGALGSQDLIVDTPWYCENVNCPMVLCEYNQSALAASFVANFFNKCTYL